MNGIKNSLTILFQALRLVWDDLLTFVLCNLLWVLLCVPIVTAPAAFAGLYFVADLAARRKALGINDFFVGFRSYFMKATLLGLINLLTLLIIAFNISFYSGLETIWAVILQALWLLIGLFWMILQVYLYPMLVAQVEPKIWWAIRNTILLVLAHPIFALTIAIFVWGILIAGFLLALPLLLFGMSLIAVISSLALYDRMALIRQKKPPSSTESSIEKSPG